MKPMQLNLEFKNRSVCAYGNHPCHGHGAVDKWTKDALFARCY
jgi:hypothetical protein